MDVLCHQTCLYTYVCMFYMHTYVHVSMYMFGGVAVFVCIVSILLAHLFV